MDNHPRSCKQITKYVVQCERCFKWSWIPSLEDYEVIREKWSEKPWQCYRNLDLCHDHTHVQELNPEQDICVIDAPDIPRTPPGCRRILIMRGDYTKMDVTYVVLDLNVKIRSFNDVLKFLEIHPEFARLFHVGNFSFTSPRMPAVVPPDIEGIISESRKKKKQHKEEGSPSLISLRLYQDDMQPQGTEIVATMYASNSGVGMPRSRGPTGPAVAPTIPEHEDLVDEFAG